MTRQRNLILSAAVAAAFGATAMSAHAGVASALPAKIATAALKSNAQEFKGNQLTYSTQVPLSALTVYYVYVKLLTGTFTGAPDPTLFSSNDPVLQNALTSATGTLSADGTFAVYTLGSTATVVPVNTTISFTPKGTAAPSGGVGNLVSLLSGGNVNEQISIGSSANTSSVLADIDSAAGGNIITFTAPQTYLALASSVAPVTFGALNLGNGTGPETTQINVATGTGVSLTSVAEVPGSIQTIDFGGFVLSDVGSVLDASQASSWAIANEYTGGALSATVTGNFAAASSMYLSTDITCANVSNALTLNTAKTSATLAAGTLWATSGLGQVVCMITNGTTTIPATTPTISITTSSVNGSDVGAPLSYGPSTLYALAPNGGTVVIRAYLPAASGFIDVVRIINNGLVASSVTVARIDPVTGIIGNSGVLAGGTLAAGGATNYTNTVIEAALGGPLAAGDRPRLLFTANTTIEGQNYIINPDGTVTTLHGIDVGSVP
jgi:hypothetical protein